MLKINNLHVSVGDRPILKGLTLDVPAGEVHANMGPNGAGTAPMCYCQGGGTAMTDVAINPADDLPLMFEDADRLVAQGIADMERGNESDQEELFARRQAKYG